MVFHFGSYTLGFASGVAAAKLTPRLRKLGLELATVGFRMFDGLTVRMARKREDLEDLVAEARARARARRAPESAHRAELTGGSDHGARSRRYLQIVHVSPGRVRLRMPSLRDAGQICAVRSPTPADQGRWRHRCRGPRLHRQRAGDARSRPDRHRRASCGSCRRSPSRSGGAAGRVAPATVPGCYVAPAVAREVHAVVPATPTPGCCAPARGGSISGPR